MNKTDIRKMARQYAIEHYGLVLKEIEWTYKNIHDMDFILSVVNSGFLKVIEQSWLKHVTSECFTGYEVDGVDYFDGLYQDTNNDIVHDFIANIQDRLPTVIRTVRVTNDNYFSIPLKGEKKI